MKNLQGIQKEIEEKNPLYYVYMIHYPDGSPMYVGKGNKKRIGVHESEARNPKIWKGKNLLKTGVINEIWKNGDEVLYSIIEYFDNEDDAIQKEIEIISQIGRSDLGNGPLVNRTGGGEGWGRGIPQQFSVETRKKISNTLKEYYVQNPEARKARDQKASQHYKDNPESVERARRNFIKNDVKAAYLRWLEEKPEEAQKVWDDHSQYMKEWRENNPERVKELRERQNETMRSDEHRAKMSEKTKEFRKNNPEAAQARVDAANETFHKKTATQQECFRFLEAKFVAEGKLATPYREDKLIRSKQFAKWREAGIDVDGLEFPPIRGKLEVWEEYRAKLNIPD